MWNIVTSIDGRQFIQATDGTFIEITVQPVQPGDAVKDSADQREALQSATTSETQRDHVAETHEMNETRPINLPINPSALQSNTVLGLQIMNVASLQTLDEAAMMTDEEVDQPVDAEDTEQETRAGEPKVGDEMLSEIRNQMSEIITELRAIKPVLHRVVYFMADMDRYMKLKPSDHSEPTRKRKFSQEFSQFDELFPVQNEEQLLALESSLCNQDMVEKFYAYFENMFCLNGKRDGNVFFKTLMRKILVASSVKTYSWKGQSRNNKGLPKIQNKSFKDTFPKFVKFVHRVVRGADYEFTEEAIHAAFSLFLRNKNTEIQRQENGPGGQREARVRRKRIVKPLDTSSSSEGNEPVQTLPSE